MGRGSSGSGFGDDQAALETSVREVVDRQRLVGLSVAAVRPGRVVWSATYGHTDLAAGIPTTPDSAYLWFSMTKIVTATAVMQLVEQGRVGLDDSVNPLVPAFGAVRQTIPVTVRHLLSHSAGLANPPPVRWVHLAGSTPPDPDVFLARRLRRHRRLRAEPGQRSRYTNLGYLVLGQVITAVAGEPYADYVARNVLGPLGMTATGFEGGRAPTEATVYQRAPHGAGLLLRAVLPAGIVGARTGEWVAYRPFRLHGAAYGGLVGPVGDAARFLAAHLNGGAIDGARILTASTAERMRQITMPGRPSTWDWDGSTAPATTRAGRRSSSTSAEGSASTTPCGSTPTSISASSSWPTPPATTSKPSSPPSWPPPTPEFSDRVSCPRSPRLPGRPPRRRHRGPAPAHERRRAGPPHRPTRATAWRRSVWRPSGAARSARPQSSGCATALSSTTDPPPRRRCRSRARACCGSRSTRIATPPGPPHVRRRRSPRYEIVRPHRPAQ